MYRGSTVGVEYKCYTGYPGTKLEYMHAAIPSMN